MESKELSKPSKEVVSIKQLKTFEKCHSVTAIKIALDLLGPVGSIINEVIFEHHSRIKQERVNYFILSFTKYLKDQGLESVEIEKVNIEDFGDVFEMIIRKVSQTKSKEKIERFKKILIGEILKPKDSEFKETFIDIVGKLNETQIIILLRHKDIYEKIGNTSYDHSMDDFRMPYFFKLEEGEFSFFLQDLDSKSLLFELNKSIATDPPNQKMIKCMGITEFGIEFLKFIENK